MNVPEENSKFCVPEDDDILPGRIREKNRGNRETSFYASLFSLVPKGSLREVHEGPGNGLGESLGVVQTFSDVINISRQIE